MFSSGIKTCFTPERWAAISFSGRPPIGLTPPWSETSPVIATEGLTGIPVNSEASAVEIVMPAEGPSLGVAPSGTCT